MRLIFKFLGALALSFTGAAAIAGVFLSSFGNFGLEAITDPALNSTQSGAVDSSVGRGADAQVREVAAKTEVPEKQEPLQNKVLAPEVEDLVRTAQEAALGHALTVAGVIEETNRHRQINLGLGHVLAENEILNQAAQAKVDDMFAGQYFEHVSPLGDDASYFVGKTGYEYIAIGENLAMGNYNGDGDLVQAWMDSPGHRENILKAGFTEIGVAVGYGNFEGRMVWLAVQEFGTPESACPAVDEPLSDLIDSQKAELDGYADWQEKQSAKIDMKKDVIESLENELKVLADSGGSYAQLKEKQQVLAGVVEEVNNMVVEYNERIQQVRALYDDYKENVETYNVQIGAYNSCVDKF